MSSSGSSIEESTEDDPEEEGVMPVGMVPEGVAFEEWVVESIGEVPKAVEVRLEDMVAGE